MLFVPWRRSFHSVKGRDHHVPYTLSSRMRDSFYQSTLLLNVACSPQMRGRKITHETKSWRVAGIFVCKTDLEAKKSSFELIRR